MPRRFDCEPIPLVNASHGTSARQGAAHRAVREAFLPLSFLRRFGRDESGGVAIMTVLLSVPLLIAVGVAIDTAEIIRARENLQAASDAAVLSAAQSIMAGAEPGDARRDARNVFDAQMLNIPRSRAKLQIDATREACRKGELVARASMEHPLFFGAVTGLLVAGASHGGIRVSSAANCGNDTVEVALVLDNSGSMEGSKLEALQRATRKLVRDLFQAAQASSQTDPVSFALVPFATMVNVGPANADAPWMDRHGDVDFHHENFDWAHAGVRREGNRWYSGETALTRFVVYDQLRIAWRGCVEKRRHPLHTTDAPADRPERRFVPALAPDEPDDWTGEYERAQRNGPQGRRISEWPYHNSYVRDDRGYPHYAQSRNHHHPDFTGAPFGQIYRQFWVTKYFFDTPVDTSRAGPNDFCETAPLTPLTTSQTTMISRLNAMKAAGATDIQAGVSWGWKTLSPSEPFAQGRPYGAQRNTKVMIVMTDGENTYYPNDRPTRSHYGAFGQAWQGRLFAGLSGTRTHDAASYTAAMNEHLLQTCTNARAAGITIYTIAFDVPEGSTARTVMQACASEGEGGRLAFDASDNAALEVAFEAIGRSIQKLKLTR